MGSWCSSFDADEFFSYQTSKIVIIKDRYLGILRSLMVLGILLYVIVYVIFLSSGYLKFEVPIGILYTSLQKPPALDIVAQTLPYCAQYTGTIPTMDPRVCLAWDEFDDLFPVDQSDAMLMSTRIQMTPQQRQCDLLATTCVTPWVTNGNVSEFYVADIESFTILVKHAFQARDFFQQTGDSRYSRSSLQMDGYFADYQGNIVFSFPNGKPDIFSVEQVLSAAGVMLDEPTDVPGESGSMRHSGIIILILIVYENSVLDSPTCMNFELILIKSDTYYVSRVPNNEYKVIEVLENANQSLRTTLNRHGIKIIFQQSGKIGMFDIQTTLLALVTSLGLLTVSTLIVDSIMVMVMPLRRWYQKYKYQETIDFSIIQDIPPENFKVLNDDNFNASIHDDLRAHQEQNMDN